MGFVSAERVAMEAPAEAMSQKAPSTTQKQVASRVASRWPAEPLSLLSGGS